MTAAGYRGRFAPSPTGPLHFGSLAAAVASYLDAKHHDGIWLLRMEDLDVPRSMPGASEDILDTLSAFGLASDEPVMHQSQRTSAYEMALQQLKEISAAYPCCCTRREILDSTLHGIEGPVYPGTCRKGIAFGREGKAWRVRTNDEAVAFEDRLQGRISQHIESGIGDFIVRRADNLFAYQLAVVVDDAAQKITHVVRGADLLYSTPRQMHLQKLLGLATPNYMHLPIAVNGKGEKLSKQTLARPVEKNPETMFKVLLFLRQQPPDELRSSGIEEMLSWAVAHWQPERIAGCRQFSV